MWICAFVGFAVLGYFCGLLGGVLGVKGAVVLRRESNTFLVHVNIKLGQVFSVWPELFIKTMAFATSLVLCRSENGWAYCGAICFVSGFLMMRFVPQIVGFINSKMKG